VYRDVLGGLAMLRKGARQVSGGDVCGGAASSRRGARALQQTVAQFERLVATLVPPTGYAVRSTNG
jgi:hypothetical protein